VGFFFVLVSLSQFGLHSSSRLLLEDETPITTELGDML